MATARGFWSYVHADDDAEGGRIIALARDLAAQYEMLTGESVDLFLDRDDLSWGDDWRAAVDGSLAGTAFFIPILTPRYFLSAECRRELNAFVRKAQRLGLEDLILPILYIDSPLLREDPPSDDAVALVKPFQWIPWTDLRFASRDERPYREAVAGMAARLVEANSRADEISRSMPIAEDDDEDAPGSADLMATAEVTLDQWADTVNSLGESIAEIGQVVSAMSVDLNDPKSAPKTFAARLTVLRKLATQLQGPAAGLQEKADMYTAQLNDVDAGVMEMIPAMSAEVAEDPSKTAQACEFFNSIRSLAQSSDEGLGSLKQMIDAIQPIERMSRDLRAPLRTLHRGLTSMYESRRVINAWVTAIDETGVECPA
jgi:hypothetical protein